MCACEIREKLVMCVRYSGGGKERLLTFFLCWSHTLDSHTSVILLREVKRKIRRKEFSLIKYKNKSIRILDKSFNRINK